MSRWRQEERLAAAAEVDEDERPPLLPTAYDSLRRVPAYGAFIQERFERCLDLYLCPRAKKKRAFLASAESVLPRLPKPRDLQPFPSILALRLLGHTAPVRSRASTLLVLAAGRVSVLVPSSRANPGLLLLSTGCAAGRPRRWSPRRCGRWRWTPAASGWRRAATMARCGCGRRAPGAACAPGRWAGPWSASPGAQRPLRACCRPSSARVSCCCRQARRRSRLLLISARWSGLCDAVPPLPALQAQHLHA